MKDGRQGDRTVVPRGFDSFTLGRFRFRFRVTEDLTLPRYKGGVLRGALGKAMRQMSCIPKWDRPCSCCLLKGDCAYSYLFETPNMAPADILDGVSHAPHPFVLRPLSWEVPASTMMADRNDRGADRVELLI